VLPACTCYRRDPTYLPTTYEHRKHSSFTWFHIPATAPAWNNHRRQIPVTPPAWLPLPACTHTCTALHRTTPTHHTLLHYRLPVHNLRTGSYHLTTTHCLDTACLLRLPPGLPLPPHCLLLNTPAAQDTGTCRIRSPPRPHHAHHLRRPFCTPPDCHHACRTAGRHPATTCRFTTTYTFLPTTPACTPPATATCLHAYFPPFSHATCATCYRTGPTLPCTCRHLPACRTPAADLPVTCCLPLADTTARCPPACHATTATCHCAWYPALPPWHTGYLPAWFRTLPLLHYHAHLQNCHHAARCWGLPAGTTATRLPLPPHNTPRHRITCHYTADLPCRELDTPHCYLPAGPSTYCRLHLATYIPHMPPPPPGTTWAPPTPRPVHYTYTACATTPILHFLPP